jgi:hypothetical protein
MDKKKLIYVCCVKDHTTGDEKLLGIMSEQSLLNCIKPYWHYVRKMEVPLSKIEGLHIGNVKNYLNLYEIF